MPKLGWLSQQHITMMIPAKRSFLVDTGRQFAEQTTIHGVSYIAFLLNKREISFLTPLNPNMIRLIYFSWGQLCRQFQALTPDQPPLVLHLHRLLQLCRLPGQRVVHDVAEGAGDHHLEERRQAGLGDPLPHGHHLQSRTLHGECEDCLGEELQPVEDWG